MNNPEASRARSESCPDAAVQYARIAIRRMFEVYDRYTLDDSELAPFIGCVVDAVEEYAREVGVAPEEAAALRERAVRCAVEIYVNLCKQNNPDRADPDQDEETFRYLVAHGRWPDA